MSWELPCSSVITKKQKSFFKPTHFTKKRLIYNCIKLWFKHTNLPSSIKWGKKRCLHDIFHSSLSFKGTSNRSKESFACILFQLPQQGHWPAQQLPVLLSDLPQNSPKPHYPFNPNLLCGHRRTHVSNGERSYNQLFSMRGWVEQKGYWLLSLTALDLFKSWRAECRSRSPQASKVCMFLFEPWLLPFLQCWQFHLLAGNKQESKPASESSDLYYSKILSAFSSAAPEFRHRKPPSSPQTQKPLFCQKRKCHINSPTRQSTVNYRG